MRGDVATDMANVEGTCHVLENVWSAWVLSTCQSLFAAGCQLPVASCQPTRRQLRASFAVSSALASAWGVSFSVLSVFRGCAHQATHRMPVYCEAGTDSAWTNKLAYLITCVSVKDSPSSTFSC